MKPPGRPGTTGREASSAPTAWVVGPDRVAAALAAASDAVAPVAVDPTDPPDGRPAAVVAVGAVPDDPPDAPLAVVGVDADPAAYEAGADAVIAVDPVERPGPVAAWLDRTAGRGDDRYRRLFDEAGDGVVVHDAETGDVVEANARFRDLLGLDPDEAVTVESFSRAGGNADRARELVRETAREGPRVFEWEHADGRRVEVSLAPATVAGRERVVATVRDVTERHDREARFERTLERVDDAVFALDEEWAFTYLNEAGAETVNAAAGTALSPEALRGRTIWELVPGAVDTEFYEQYTGAMEDQEVRQFEAYYEPLETWFEARVYPSPEGVSVYFTDVTDRRTREARLRELFDTARALMRVESRESVADRLADAAAATLGFAGTGVRLREDDSLVVAALAGETPVERPTVPLDGSPHGRALRTGEPVVDEVGPDDRFDRDQYERVLYVPVGNHGVMSLGRAAGEFDDTDRRLAGLLAALGESAFDRVDRRAELRRYETVLETAEGMVFVVDADRRFTLVTEPLAARLGYERSEILGRHVSDVLDDGAVAETGEIREALRTAGDGGSQTFEVDVHAADGERVPLEVELTAFDHGDERGTVGVVTDRSALRDARAELETERDRLTYLFENLPDPAVEYDVDPLSGEAVVRSANPAFCEAFDVDRTRALGAPLSELVTGVADEDAPERLAGVAPGEVVSAEVDREAADERRTFLFRGVSFRADDRVRAFGIYTDITDGRRRERYLQVVSRVLRHNLRNDLNVVLALVDRIRGEVDGDAAAALERIAGVVNDLSDLSRDANDLATVVGRGDTTRTTVDVARVVRSVAAEADGVVETDLPAELSVVADARVERALAEVVENALVHAADAPTPPRITATTDDDWVHLRVADDGPGISETERAVVSGEREITQTDHGSGLGLWLARWVVEDAGGRLSFEEPDRGTAVVFSLPRR